MRTLRMAPAVVAFCLAVQLPAADLPDVVAANAIERDILKLGTLRADIQRRAVHYLVLRIRQQPAADAAGLACDLALFAADLSENLAASDLQEVATTLADSIREAPPKHRNELQYQRLAELTYYFQAQVSLDDPRYAAAVSKLETDDRYRSQEDFTLRDPEGYDWNLKSLRGKVVLVSFWATWCIPCRGEIPDLVAAYQRFRDQGLVILAMSDEKAGTLKRFAARAGVNYPLLLDPANRVKDRFHIEGIPQTLVYDRDGHLVSHAFYRPTRDRLQEMLAQAGLR